jgi:hypothetical protein
MSARETTRCCFCVFQTRRLLQVTATGPLQSDAVAFSRVRPSDRHRKHFAEQYARRFEDVVREPDANRVRTETITPVIDGVVAGAGVDD